MPIDVVGTTLTFPRGNLTTSYSPENASITASISGPDGNFKGKALFKFPFDYSDYQKGLVEITPAPSKVLPGLIIVYEGLDLGKGQEFKVKVSLEKKPDENTISRAFIPVFKAQEKQEGLTSSAIATEKQASQASNPPREYLFIAILLLIPIGLYHKMTGKKN